VAGSASGNWTAASGSTGSKVVGDEVSSISTGPLDLAARRKV
jgi:hypothetical protein